MANAHLSPIVRHIRHLIGAGPCAGMTDGQLLDRFVTDREEAAMEVLVRRYGSLVLGVCRRVLLDVHAAEDVFQAAFLVLVRKAPSLDRRQPLGNWLYTIAYRLALRARASAARRRDCEQKAASLRSETTGRTVSDEVCVALEEELQRLPEKLRTPLVLCYLEGKTNEEAARLLGCPKGSMSWRLAQARELLRERLLNRGFAFPVAGVAGLLTAASVRATVPMALLETTVKAAMWFAGENAMTAGFVSAEAVHLAQGMLKAMLTSKLKFAAAAFLTVSFLGMGGGAALSVQRTASAQSVAAPSARQITPEKPPAKEPAVVDNGERLPDGATARLGTLLFRHGDRIFFVAYGPGGKTLVTASEDGTLRLWDAATGQELRRFDRSEGKKEPASDGVLERVPRMMRGPLPSKGFLVALSRDGKLLAASQGNSVLLWDVATGKKLHQLQMPLQGLQPNVQALIFTPDGKSLVAAGHDRSVVVWDTATGKAVRTVDRKIQNQDGGFIFTVNNSATNAALSPDGNLLACQELDGKQQTISLKVVDLTTGKELPEIKTPVGGAQGLTFSPDGKTLAFGTVQGYVELWDVAAGKELRRLEPEQVSRAQGGCLAFSPDGKTLAAGQGDRSVQLWDVATGKKLRQIGEAAKPDGVRVVVVIRGFQAEPQADLAFSPDGKTLAASRQTSSVHQYDVETGKEVAAVPAGHQTAVSTLWASPDGKTVMTFGRGDAVRVWDLNTGKELRQVPVPNGTTCVTLSPDGSVVAAGGPGSAVELRDTATGKELRKLETNLPGVVALAFSPDGKSFAARGPQSPLIRLFDVATGKESRVIGEEPDTGGEGFKVVRDVSGVLSPMIAFTPAGRALATSGAKNQLCLYDVSSGTKLREFAFAAEQAVEKFVFSPNGRSLATANRDGTLSVYETATGERRCQFGKAADGASRRPVAMVMVNNMVYDVLGTGQDVPVGLTFSQDGRVVAASNTEPAIRLWDTVTGKELGQLQGHQGNVVSLAFAPDGKRLISGSLDTTALLWDVAGSLKSEPPSASLEAKALEAAWADLAGKDAVKAFEAMRQLRSAQAQSAGFLKDHVRPAEPADPQRVARLVADLDDNSFEVRQKATVELEQFGDLAETELRKVLQAGPSLEVQQRVERLLQKLSGQTAGGEMLRELRAVELLESIGGSEARQVLEVLAKGATGARLTKDAQSALDRMARRSVR
jgi:RNA polymerase sigma factor (sigma-70 family)